MQYVVTKDHRTEFSNPLKLTQGEKIIVTQETDAEYPDWFFCKKTDGSNEGWVPVENFGKH